MAKLRGLSWDRFRSPRGLLGIAAVLVLLVGGIWLLAGRDAGGDETVPPTPEVPKTSDPCELWTVAELQRWLGGSPWEQDDETSGGPVCTFEEVDGPGIVTATLSDTPTQAFFDPLRVDREAVPVSGIGDEAWWWEEPSRPGGGMVLRVGGRAVTIDLAGQYDDRLAKAVAAASTVPDAEGDAEADPNADLIPALGPQEITIEILRRLTALGETAGDRLESTPFEPGESPGSPDGSLPADAPKGEATCAALSLDVLSADMQVSSEGASLSSIGGRSCTFSNDQGINVTVELLSSDADETALGVGREMTMDGETFVWEPVEVAGLGDGAVWMVDPVSGTTGDLHALFGTTLVKVTSTGPTSDRVRERAEAAMAHAGPQLAALGLADETGD